MSGSGARSCSWHWSSSWPLPAHGARRPPRSTPRCRWSARPRECWSGEGADREPLRVFRPGPDSPDRPVRRGVRDPPRRRRRARGHLGQGGRGDGLDRLPRPRRRAGQHDHPARRQGRGPNHDLRGQGQVLAAREPRPARPAVAARRDRQVGAAGDRRRRRDGGGAGGHPDDPSGRRHGTRAGRGAVRRARLQRVVRRPGPGRRRRRALSHQRGRRPGRP